MQALLEFAIDQIALEGREGCSLSRFIDLLENESSDHLPEQFQNGIPPTIMHWLIEMLKGRSPDIKFVEPKKPDMPQVVIENVPDFRSMSASQKENIFLQASQGVCDASVGLYDEHLSNFKISVVQRRSLEVVGMRRWQGALRTELAKCMKCDAVKFHYILKLLEARRLVVLSPVLAKEGTSNVGHGIQTALVHLRRFAPKLTEGQIFTETGTGPGKFTVSDDQSRQMQKICEHLNQASDKMLVEAELKQVLGFRLTQGHRGWRRMRAHLEKMGHIESFKATFADRKGKAKTVIKLLKPFVAGKSAKAKEEEEEDDDEGEGDPTDMTIERGFDGQVISILARAGREGINKHMIGKRLGVSMKKMKKRMDEIVIRYGIIETNEQAGKQIVKRWTAPESIITHHEEQMAGPQPEGGFAQLLQTVLDATPIPEELTKAIEEKYNSPPASPPLGRPTASAGRPARSQAGALAAESDVNMPAMEPPTADGNTISDDEAADFETLSGPRKVAVEAILSMEDIKTKVPGQEPMSERVFAEPERIVKLEPAILDDLPEGQLVPDMPVDLLDDVSAVAVTNVGVTNIDTLASKQSSIAQDRLDRLCKKLEEDRYILKVDIANFFMDSEGNDGKMILDKRTVMRIVDRGVATGRLQHFVIHSPEKLVNMPESINVITLPDIVLEGNQALIREIRKVYVKRSTQRYQKAANQDAGRGQTVKHVQTITRLKLPVKVTAADGDDEDADAAEPMQALMWENGLIHARMTKARLLHSFLCKLVGLAGCSEGLRNVLEPELLNKDLPESLSTPVMPPMDYSTRTLDYSLMSGPLAEKQVEGAKISLAQAAETNKGLFTIQALFPTLPLDLFCQVVGCSNRNAAVQELIVKGVPIGNLTPEQNHSIIDIHAKKRLSGILGILSKLGLVKSAIYSLNTHYTRTERSVFILKPDVTFQEPKRLTEPSAEATAYAEVKFDLRAEEDLDSYWNRLEYACFEMPDEMKGLCPGRECEDLFRRKAWTKDRMMSMHQWVQLRTRLGQQVEEFGWKHCQKAATDLGLDPDQVSRISITFRNRVSRQRERLQPGAKLPKLTVHNRNAGRSKYESEAARIQTNQKQYKKTQKGWAMGLPTRAQHAMMLRPWEPMETDPEKRMQKLKLAEQSDGEEEDLPENVNGLTRRFGWNVEDDRFILQSYAKWHAVAGFHDCAFRSQRRPVIGRTFVERQGYKRLKELGTSPKVEALMERLHTLVRGVYERTEARGVSLKALLKIEEAKAREALKAKRRAATQQRHMEAHQKLAEATGFAKSSEAKKEQAEEDEEKDIAERLLTFPEPKDGYMFEIVTPADERDHAQILEVIQDVITMAPRRVDGVPLEAPRKRVRVMTDGAELKRAAKRRVSRPVGGTVNAATNAVQLSSLHLNLQRHVNKGSLSKAKLQARERIPLTAPVAAAAELAILQMSLSEEERAQMPGIDTALSRRFTNEQISDAFAHLRLQNFIFHDFRLSPDFKSLLQVAEQPEYVFAEAGEMVKTIEASETGIVTVAQPGEEILGGSVAEILELMACNLASIPLPPPETFRSILDAPVRQSGHKIMTDVEWPVTADCLQGVPELSSGIHLAPIQSFEPPETDADINRIMTDEKYRKQVFTRCKAKAKSSTEPTCSTQGIEDVYRTIQASNHDGQSLQQLQQQESLPQHCKPAVDILTSTGLVTQVPGFDDWVYVATELSSPFFTDPELPTTSSLQDGEEVDLKSAANGRGSKLLAPWLDHQGNLVEKSWKSFVQRIMSVILCNPGIAEGDLISEMLVLTPLSVKRLIGVLGTKQMLLCQQVQETVSDLPAIFAKPTSTKVHTHYFVDPRHCYTNASTVLPS